jgi:hypothetical protein
LALLDFGSSSWSCNTGHAQSCCNLQYGSIRTENTETKREDIDEIQEDNLDNREKLKTSGTIFGINAFKICDTQGILITRLVFFAQHWLEGI